MFLLILLNNFVGVNGLTDAEYYQSLCCHIYYDITVENEKVGFEYLDIHVH
jgi:hypothetical protein